MANWFSNLTKMRQHRSTQAGGISSFDTLPFQLEDKSDLISSDRLHVVQQFRNSVENQLEILRLSLNATSVVLLWACTITGKISTYAFSSQCAELIIGSFPVGTGIVGALKGCNDVVLAPYRSSSPAIPYYPDDTPVGGFMAQNIVCGEVDKGKIGDFGIICVDRSSTAEWTPVERTLMSVTAEQILQNLILSRDLLFTDVERRVFQLVFEGLRTLNSALDIQSVYTAARKALGLVVKADLFAVSLIHADEHEIFYLDGDCPDLVLNRKYPLADSVVGQVVKYRRMLPERYSRSGRAPIVNGLRLFDSYNSVMVVPLSLDDTPVTGVLIIASRAENQFPRDAPKMIELIAAQVAIKIELAHSHEQIQQMAITDPLTGIANRRAFRRGFAAMYERARRRHGSFSLIICDIDLFKRINDGYGHPFGDQVIQQVASLLKEVVRSGDLSARIGGEEFSILLEDTGLSGAMDVAERLRRKVEQLQLHCQGEPVPVTISLGVSVFPQDSDDQDKLFNYADQALYRAKKGGRNQSVGWGNAD